MTIYQGMSLADRNEIRKYGCRVFEMREAVESQLNRYFYTDAKEYALHLLNGAADMMEHRDNVMVLMDAQQQVNRVIWILENYVNS